MFLKFERVDGAAGSGSHKVMGRDDMNRLVGIDIGPESFKSLLALKPKVGDMLNYNDQTMLFTAGVPDTVVRDGSDTPAAKQPPGRPKPVPAAAFAFSIGHMIDTAVAAAGAKKRWGGHNRSDTVGASEVGRCARLVWYDKNDYPADPGAVFTYGALERGNSVEAWAVERMQEALVEAKAKGETDAELIWATDTEQKTLVDGYQSATPDGLFVSKTGLRVGDAIHHAVYNELKSMDPRAFDYLNHAKPEHVAQVQQGMDLVRRLTEYKPNVAIITYVNASFVSDRLEFVVEFDPAHAAGLRERANYIMTTDTEPSPEGKLSGGRECEYCPFRQRCRNTQVAGLVEDTKELKAGDPTAQKLVDMLRRRNVVKDNIEEAETERRTIDDYVMECLKELQVNKVTIPGFSLSMRKAYGPPSIDKEKMLAAGINPDDYTKPSSSYMRLDIRNKK